jgi:hypothetical protein
LFQVDFTTSGIQLKLREKPIKEVFSIDGKDGTTLGICKGLEGTCIKPNTKERTLLYTNGVYVCKLCNQAWEKANEADSTAVETVTRKTRYAELDINFAVTRTG